MKGVPVRLSIVLPIVAVAAVLAVGAAADESDLRQRAVQIFGPLPSEAPSPDNPVTKEKVELGRHLYYEKRLSRSQEISCNSCHMLDKYGVDNLATSPGHEGQLGERNSPTTLNAALHIAQFWDGREPDVEAQAGGPMMNPVEMAMPGPDVVEKTLRSIPEYEPLFEAAFPKDPEPIHFTNARLAIAAFERGLLTPAPFDDYMQGDTDALSEQQKRGLATFMDVGCITCHNGALVGGQMFQKIGLVHPYETEDLGRYEVTGKESDKYVFKVPSLRNVAQTAPYFHDGSIETLDAAIRIMAEHQLGVELSADQVTAIRAFLNTLTGRIDPLYTAKPELPESGPETPAPDAT